MHRTLNITKQSSYWLEHYRIVDYLFLLILFLFLVSIAGLKLDSLYSWRYTLDIFANDLVLQETLAGNFGLDYAYGNAFGDHAYVILLLMLPLKLVLGRHMVVLLTLLGPLSCFVTGATLYFSARRLVDTGWAFIYGLIFLTSFGVIVDGLYEGIYGFHPDVLSGFFAVIFTLFLVLYDKAGQSRQKTFWPLLGFGVFYGLFMSLKEEMALLGIVFFLITLLLKRNRFHAILLIASAAIFGLEMIFIRLARTPFNRSNEALLQSFFNLLKQERISIFYDHPQLGGSDYFLVFWLVILASIVTMGVSILLLKKVNLYAMALLVMGLVKMGFNFAITDVYLTTWHNFPAIVMLIGAVIIQLMEKEKSSNKPLALFVTLILLASFLGFINFGVPAFKEISDTNTFYANLIAPVRQDLIEVKEWVDSNKVIAIPSPTAIEWVDGYRYTIYPDGITKSLPGIAEYVILPTRPEFLAFMDLKELDEAILREDFSIIMQNDNVILLKRIQPSAQFEKERKLFIEVYGKDALGL